MGGCWSKSSARDRTDANAVHPAGVVDGSGATGAGGDSDGGDTNVTAAAEVAALAASLVGTPNAAPPTPVNGAATATATTTAATTTTTSTTTTNHAAWAAVETTSVDAAVEARGTTAAAAAGAVASGGGSLVSSASSHGIDAATPHDVSNSTAGTPRSSAFTDAVMFYGLSGAGKTYAVEAIVAATPHGRRLHAPTVAPTLTDVSLADRRFVFVDMPGSRSARESLWFRDPNADEYTATHIVFAVDAADLLRLPIAARALDDIVMRIVIPQSLPLLVVINQHGQSVEGGASGQGGDAIGMPGERRRRTDDSPGGGGTDGGPGAASRPSTSPAASRAAALPYEQVLNILKVRQMRGVRWNFVPCTTDSVATATDSVIQWLLDPLPCSLALADSAREPRRTRPNGARQWA